MLEDEKHYPREPNQEKEQHLMTMTRADDVTIKLKVAAHPSGRYTLLMYPPGARMWQDVKDPEGLLGNSDKSDFDLRVEAFMASLIEDGKPVDFIER